MTEFDKLWDYNNPAATEEKFREVLQSLSPETDLSAFLQLQTQIARTFSLRRMFDEAHAVLDEVLTQLPNDEEVAHVRYYLERGRTFNTAGKKTEAREQFLKAKELAAALNEDFYTIDAIHMLAIAAAPEEAIALNEEGVILAESSNNERAKGWLGALYNNLAWSYFDKGEFEKALSVFLRALKWRDEKKSLREIFIAKWCVARTLRALHRTDDAITIQLGLLEEMVETDQPDGYVYEELGELYLSKNEAVYKMYFGFAYNELSKDQWLAANEKARLERMKELSV
ncbi:MAG: tetratricopeptide repeat protein [Chitinophagales bacterium]|nr:tetratricopeptide repeat protein [Chitinophagales bacterium]